MATFQGLGWASLHTRIWHCTYRQHCTLKPEWRSTIHKLADAARLHSHPRGSCSRHGTAAFIKGLSGHSGRKRQRCPYFGGACLTSTT